VRFYFSEYLRRGQVTGRARTFGGNLALIPGAKWRSHFTRMKIPTLSHKTRQEWGSRREAGHPLDAELTRA
jgi:hypothetical protein